MTNSEPCEGCGSAEHSIEDCPFEQPRVHETDEDTVLGVLTGQVPVSGPMGARPDGPTREFMDRMRAQVRDGLEEQGDTDGSQ